MPTSDGEPENNSTQGSDVLFYHLERARLMDVLPQLVEKSLQRGWRVVIEADNRKQVERLNDELWTYRDDSFLPHGALDDGSRENQPVYLTDGNDNPNGAAIRFYVAGAEPDQPDDYERIVYLFDGTREEAVIAARKQWKRLTADGFKATYWRQNERGGWERQA